MLVINRDSLIKMINSSPQPAHITDHTNQVGSKFRSRSLKFPGLISGCTMDWFSVWPVDALYAVSSHYLSDLDIVISKKSVRNNLIKSMGEVHNGVANSCQLYFQRCVVVSIPLIVSRKWSVYVNVYSLA